MPSFISKNMSRPPFPKRDICPIFLCGKPRRWRLTPCPSSACQPPSGARLVLEPSSVIIASRSASGSDPRARDTNLAGPSAAEPDRTLELVREPPSPLFGLCLSGMLPDLAMWCLYRVLVSRVTILKPCDSVLVSRAVGGTHLKWRETACGPSRWPVRMESIGEHRGVVTAIGAEVASVLAAVSCAYPLVEQPPPYLNL